MLVLIKVDNTEASSSYFLNKEEFHFFVQYVLIIWFLLQLILRSLFDFSTHYFLAYLILQLLWLWLNQISRTAIYGKPVTEIEASGEPQVIQMVGKLGNIDETSFPNVYISKKVIESFFLMA